MLTEGENVSVLEAALMVCHGVDECDEEKKQDQQQQQVEATPSVQITVSKN